MMKVVIFFISICISTAAFSLSLDEKLDLIISVHELSPKECLKVNKQNIEQSKRIKLGKMLFESTVISGNNDMSCSVCHLDQFGSADGIPLAVGVMGDGEGGERYKDGHGALVQRNTLSLIGRANPDFKSFFWDGKVEQEGNFTVSQFGEFISKKFNSTLSVAAVMPILERDELMGSESLFQKNEIADEVEDQLYHKKYDAVSKIIKKRLYTSNHLEAIEIKKKLIDINITKENFELAHIGNLLADFISHKFNCTESRFDKYLKGNKHILTDNEKQGAILFYGKGRCSYCHSGNLFSDFQYHSIGAPQGYFGVHTRHRDIGRAGVTNRNEDKFKFRTPPLIEVLKTPPYGHSGAFLTLYDVVLHHINPIEFYLKNKKYHQSDFFMIGKLLNSRDNVLSSIDINSDDELRDIISFLMIL